MIDLAKQNTPHPLSLQYVASPKVQPYSIFYKFWYAILSWKMKYMLLYIASKLSGNIEVNHMTYRYDLPSLIGFRYSYSLPSSRINIQSTAQIATDTATNTWNQ